MTRIEVKSVKIADFSINAIKEINDHASNALMFSILYEMDKLRQMTIQDFRLLGSSVNTSALTSYDIDLEARTCSCQWWQVTGSFSHTLMVLREKNIRTEDNLRWMIPL